MPRTGFRISKSIAYAIIFAGILLSGCASWQPVDVSDPVDPPVVIVDTTPLDTIIRYAPEPPALGFRVAKRCDRHDEQPAGICRRGR